MRRLREQDEALLDSLTARALLIVDFLQANTDPFPSGPELRNAVLEAATAKDLKLLRIWAKEIDALPLALPAYQREGLEAVLQQKLGVDKDAERARQREEVSKILKRGTIVSEKERRRLEDYLEMLGTIGADSSEIEAVRSLLAHS